MAKITSFGKYNSKENIFEKLWNWFLSIEKFNRYAIITALLIAIATPAITMTHLSFFQHASSNKTALISVAPSTGTYAVGQQLSVNLVIDGGGQSFNAARALITVSNNLTVQNLTVTPPTSGGCNFTFINSNYTPSASNLSFAGAILNGSATSCILYTITLQANAPGTGTITLSSGSVKAYQNSGEILSSLQSGSYTIGSVLTPTPVSPTPTAIPTVTPTPTVLPTATPIPSPTSTPLSPPTISTQPTDTYATAVTLTGTKTSDTTTVFVNGSSASVTYPTTTSWQANVTLQIGQPNFSTIPTTFTVYGQNALGNSSSTVAVSITNHRLGDINGDGVIDLTDLSMFATDWENPGQLNYALSDMNGDNIVDLTDFSILAKAYGN